MDKRKASRAVPLDPLEAHRISPGRDMSFGETCEEGKEYRCLDAHGTGWHGDCSGGEE